MTASNITVDGAPLEEFIDKQHCAEIRGVLAEQIAVPLNRHQRTKHRENISRSRTDLGQVIYVKGQKETHIIVCGIVFPWVAKAPFVRSGESTLGAIEYNEESGEMKCHECGGWFASIAKHTKTHGVPVREYRIKHGLERRSRLTDPKRPKAHFPPHTKHPMVGAFTGEVRKKLAIAREWSDGNIGYAALANLRSRCKAQLSERIKELAENLGRTPTHREMWAAGLYPNTIKKRFGLPLRDIMKSLGIAPRPHGEFRKAS